jgi:hypothetical protein
MELNQAMSKAFTQLAKLYGTLSPEDIAALADGAAKLTVVRSDERVVEWSPMVDLAIKAARGVNPSDVERAAAGGSKFQIVHRKGKVVYPVDAADVASQAAQFDSEDAIAKFLTADDRLKAADLKKISAELGIQLPPDARKPEQMIAHIARSLASFGS